jgi:hypothetical protein
MKLLQALDFAIEYHDQIDVKGKAKKKTFLIDQPQHEFQPQMALDDPAHLGP